MVINSYKGVQQGANKFSHRIKPSILALAVAQAIAIAPAVQSATINLGGGCTLTDAVTSANTDTATGSCIDGSGADVINLETGVDVYLDRYAGTPNGLPIITSDITINGGGAAIIRAAANPEKFRLMEVSSASGALTLNSVTLRGGYTFPTAFPNFHGGAIYLNNGASLVGNNLTVEDSISRSSSGNGGNGGGINATGSSTTSVSVELNDSTISGNEAGSIGGGIYVNYGSLTLNNTEVSTNTARSDGGGIAVLATPLIGDTVTITDNTAGNATTSSEGGGIWAFYSASVELVGSTVFSNESTGEGGGISCDLNTSLTLTDTQISQNTAGDEGGGIYAQRSVTMIITGGSISDNTADRHGGGIYARYESSVTLQSTTVSGNSASTGQGSRYGGGVLLKDSTTLISNDTLWSNNYSRYGGAIATRSSTAGVTITIDNNTFTSNSAAAQGGALRIRFDSDTTISQSSFTENYATNGGGAIGNLTGSSMTVKDSILFNNSAGGGAGFSNSGELTVINSTISGNTANNYAGGFSLVGSSAKLINSTVVGNQALSSQGGGGIRAINTGSASLYNTIVAGNISQNGAEILEQPAGLISANANNFLGSSAVNTADAFNLFTPGAADIVATSDSATQSFALGSIVDGIANNGGPTLTHALVRNSPAIDAGDPALCTANMVSNDQRGEERDAKCDIGAYEFISDGNMFVIPVPGGKAVIFDL